MRDQFHDDLDHLAAQVADLFAAVEEAIGTATTALLTSDLKAAESVISNDLAIDALCRDIEASAIELQLRQQPVARDLRLLLAIQRIIADLDRSGELAKHIAKQARRRYPNQVVPDALRPTVAEMGNAAKELLHKAGAIFTDRDPVQARELKTDDDRIDELHRELLREVVASTGDGAVEAAVDLTLCGRYYERFADHSVAIARQVIYLATGEHV